MINQQSPQFEHETRNDLEQRRVALYNYTSYARQVIYREFGSDVLPQEVISNTTTQPEATIGYTPNVATESLQMASNASLTSQQTEQQAREAQAYQRAMEAYNEPSA